MRTDDPRRDSVVTSVREQVAVVEEIVKATLVEISEWSKPNVAELALQLLREAQINSVAQLREHSSKNAAMIKVKEEACEILQCQEEEVRMRVEQLRQEVEGLGQQGKASAHDNTDSSGSAQGESDRSRQYNSVETNDQSNQSLQMRFSKTWMQSSQPYCVTTPRDGSENCQGIQQSSVTGEDNEFSLSDYMRTMSLPEVQPFLGRPGECFKRFLSSFDMKYPKDLRTLTIRSGQTVSEFCLRFRKLSELGLPRNARRSNFLAESGFCAGNLPIGMETSSCEQAYEKVKEAALRLERSLQIADEYRSSNNTRPTH
ncbi:hypothetical protein OSTOST_20110, partial [Ostertagia ostertagi]